MKPITRWHRKNEKGVFEFNHIEDGHVPTHAKLPTPKCEIHKKSWSNGVWQFSHAWLTDELPPKVIYHEQMG